jgi:predicted CXXCH cytochrome family protein
MKAEYKLLLGIIMLILLLLQLSPYTSSAGERVHFDKARLPRGCGSCHRGHGVFNTPMLYEAPGDISCFRCHSSTSIVESAREGGYISRNIEVSDLQRVFNKPYRHPVEITGVRQRGKMVPERNRTAQRHAECVDCHHHHYASKENRFAGVKGVNSAGMMVQRIDSEYELCFKCHSFSANLPADQKNKADQFSMSNPSYHPVITEGKNSDVPSLIFPLTASSLIKCTDCHNNDDSSGPQGPHGSSYQYILKKNYSSSDGPEGPYQYELCYSCHRRESILSNESFFYHDLHISVAGASCRTCHNPHGSTQYTHLIDFNNLNISPSSKGFVEFRDLGKRAGECFLTCHGKDHNPATYPTAGTVNSSSSRFPR